MSNLIDKLGELGELGELREPKRAAEQGDAAPFPEQPVLPERPQRQRLRRGTPPPLPPQAAPPGVPSAAAISLEQQIEAVRKENEALLARVHQLEQAEESSARQSAGAQGPIFLGAQIMEQFAGRMKVRDKMQEVWWYKIDLPPSGGMALVCSGQWYFHGQVYKFTLDTLRTIKDMVGKCWQHEANIKGNDENFYRPQLGTTVHGHDRGVRGLPPGTLLRG